MTTIVMTFFFDIILAILIYNILLRLGSHYDFDDGRIIQYAKGECIITSKDFSD